MIKVLAMGQEILGWISSMVANVKSRKLWNLYFILSRVHLLLFTCFYFFPLKHVLIFEALNVK